MFNDHRISKDNVAWSPTPDAQSPWDYEWIDFIDSIRNDKPHNEARRAVFADYRRRAKRDHGVRGGACGSGRSPGMSQGRGAMTSTPAARPIRCAAGVVP